MNANTNTNKLPRPSRCCNAQNWPAGFEVTAAALRVGNALRAVKTACAQQASATEHFDLTPTAIEEMQLRCIGAKRNLRKVKHNAGLL